MGYVKPDVCWVCLRIFFDLFSAVSSRVLTRAVTLPLVLTLGAGSVQAKPDVTFIDQSNLSGTNIPVTFGQVFAPGDVPEGLSMKVNVGGNSLLTQVDDKAVHPDGSLRHAVITTWLPALSAGQSLAAELVTSNPAEDGLAVSTADLLATSFDAVIELTLDEVVYTASAREALLADDSKRWLEGSLVTEFTLKRPFTTAGGSIHPHLMARFDVRAYKGLDSVRVDAIVENNWTYEVDPSNLTYDARVLIGEAEAYRLTELTHYRRARWHKVFWWGREQDVYVRHDTNYLQQTKAVPHYDPAVIASESSLAQMEESVYAPMDNVDLQTYMPAAGGDPAIGPLPRWAALYLISGDVRAYRAVLANGDAGGSYSIHLRKKLTDYPVSIDDHPKLGNNSAGSDKPPPCTETGTSPDTWTCRNPYTPDSAHQPSIAYLPYLLTGDHFYLDELLFWTTFNWIHMGYSTREEDKGILKGQVRGQAWSLRTLGQTAYILPDAHPMKSYFTEKLGNNRDRLMAFYVDNPEANKLGVAHNYQSLADLSKPWMDDFFTWSMGYLTELGFSDFLPVLEWKSKYPIGRMTSAGDEYCWIFGAVYTHDLGPDTSKWGGNPDNWFQTISEVYQATYANWETDDGSRLLDQSCASVEMATWLTKKGDRPYAVGEMYGHASSALGYPANLQPTLATLVDAGIPNSDLAWTRLATSASRPAYTESPQFAVSPRLLNPQGPQPNVNFSADRLSVPAGEQVTLTWQVTGADGCVASGAWSGSKALTGTFNTGSIDATSVYTLNCNGEGGDTARSVLISLFDSGTPNVNLSASPASIIIDESSTLSWSSTNTDSCTASGAWSGSKGTSGSETVSPTSDSTYTLSCTGNGGSTDSSFEITVTPEDRDDSSGGGSFTLWSLLFMGLFILWGRLRIFLLPLRRCFSRLLLRVGIMMICAITAMSAQADTPGLVLHWSFDEATVVDKTVGDVSGMGNDGTYSEEAPELIPGKLGQAMRFDDVNRADKVGRWEMSGFPSEEFSLSVWVRSTDSNGSSTLFSYRSRDRESVLFKVWGVHDLSVLVNGSHIKDTAVSLGDGQWHHLVVSWARRNGVLTIYRDGVKVYQAVDVNRTQAIPTEGRLNAGVDQGKWSTAWGDAFGGDMDDLRLYDRRLSQDEITWLASATPLDDSQPPAAPSDLQAVAVSSRESYLRWDAPTDDNFVAGYRIYRDAVLAGVTGDTAFVDEGMTPGNSHNYTIVAFDGADNRSPVSAAVVVESAGSGSVLDILPPGHWYEIKNSSIWAQLGVKPDVMGSWSGGIYDSRRERLVVWGGGHLNYDGNELYAFDFNNFRWRFVTQKTPKEQRVKSVDIYDDGLPSSRHTYNGLQYIPTIDRFFSSGGSVWGSGGCLGGTWLYDFGAVPAESGWQNIEDDKGGCAMTSAYDPVTGHVWYTSGGNMYEFDPLNLSAPWTKRRSNNVQSDMYMTTAIDPGRRKLVMLGGTKWGEKKPKTVIYDISNPEAVTGGVVTTSGATEIEDSDAAGFEFDPVSDRFVAWRGGDQVYTLASDTLQWFRMTPAATNLITPSAPIKNGTYGRFRYVPSKNLFVVVNDMTQNMFVYKLSEGSGSSAPFPSLDFEASSTSVNVGETVNLTWSASNAESCNATDGWAGNKALSSNEIVGPLSEDTNFTLTCSSDAGDAVRSVLVTISATAPRVNLSASPASVIIGESNTLSWSSINTDSCTASGAWSGSKNTSGSETVSPTSNSAYTLTCTGDGGDATTTFEIMVTVTPTVQDKTSGGSGSSGLWSLLFLGLIMVCKKRPEPFPLRRCFLRRVLSASCAINDQRGYR